jgi:thiamine-monophosphate kinase
MKMEEIIENRMIDQWVKGFTKPANRVNAAHESDAELVEMAGCPESFLAVTIDTVAEEIAEGIYRDPFTAGWVAIVASLSDLSAVGAEPLGLVVAVTLDQSKGADFQAGVAQGMEAACRAGGTAILGGDTNFGDRTILTSCALGLVPKSRMLTRRGCSAGDAVYASGRLGTGNALGLARLAGLPEQAFPEELYRPAPRIAEGRLAREYATCCMDSSDGLFATLDQLMRINDIGFRIDCDWQNVLAAPALELARKTGTPGWAFAAAPHGEFELVATVAPAREKEFLAGASAQGRQFVRLGTVQEKFVTTLVFPSGRTVDADLAPFRNLLFELGGDLKRFQAEFLQLGVKMGLE